MSTTVTETKPKSVKPVRHFMLHVDPKDCPARGLEKLGRYKGADYRGAALKAATKLRTREDMKDMRHLVMRAMGTKCCSRFEWSMKELDKPRVVAKKDKENNDRQISYRWAPRVKLVERFVMDAEPDDDMEDLESAPAK